VNTDSDKVKGRVIWYDPGRSKGYGFIAVAGRQDDLFVHASELARAGIETLEKGDWVLCRIGEAPDTARPCAVDIEVA
jgi:cold shock protein